MLRKYCHLFKICLIFCVIIVGVLLGMNIMLLFCGLAAAVLNSVVVYALIKNFMADMKISPDGSTVRT